jgi:hypothetical protein
MAIWNITCTNIWYYLRSFGNLVAIWYIFPLLVYCVKKNLATLTSTREKEKGRYRLCKHKTTNLIPEVNFYFTPRGEIWHPRSEVGPLGICKVFFFAKSSQNQLSHKRNSDSDRCGILFNAMNGTLVYIPKLFALAPLYTGEVHPWGPTSLLEETSPLCPTNVVKNWPL